MNVLKISVISEVFLMISAEITHILTEIIKKISVNINVLISFPFRIINNFVFLHCQNKK